MPYFCPVCKTGGHTTVEHARQHYAAKNAATARGAVNRVSSPGYTPAPWRGDPATDRQLRRIERVCASLEVSVPLVMTKGEASDTIRVLDSIKGTSSSLPPLVPAGPPVPAFQPPPEVYRPRPWQASAFEPLPVSTVARIPAGRYAVTVSDGSQTAFIRLARPKTGRMVGTTTVQSKHGEAWTSRLRYMRDGTPIRLYNQAVHGMDISEILTQILMAPAETALAYAERWHTCCRCGTELTDDRSRYYGIGPECEKHRPDVIGLVTERKGAYTPGAASPW